MFGIFQESIMTPVLVRPQDAKKIVIKTAFKIYMNNLLNTRQRLI